MSSTNKVTIPEAVEARINPTLKDSDGQTLEARLDAVQLTEGSKTLAIAQVGKWLVDVAHETPAEMQGEVTRGKATPDPKKMNPDEIQREAGKYAHRVSTAIQRSECRRVYYGATALKNRLDISRTPVKVVLEITTALIAGKGDRVDAMVKMASEGASQQAIVKAHKNMKAGRAANDNGETGSKGEGTLEDSFDVLQDTCFKLEKDKRVRLVRFILETLADEDKVEILGKYLDVLIDESETPILDVAPVAAAAN